MIIHDPQEERKVKVFIPLAIILVLAASIGGYVWYNESLKREPITIEYTALPVATSSISVTSSSTESSIDIPVVHTEPFVASRGGTTYYPVGCKAANRLSEKNKIYFLSKEEAARFGYKPSKSCK